MSWEQLEIGVRFFALYIGPPGLVLAMTVSQAKLWRKVRGLREALKAHLRNSHHHSDESAEIVVAAWESRR